MAEDPGLSRAAALHGDGRPAEAVAAYREALANDPENAGIWHNMGVALAETGDRRARRSTRSTARWRCVRTIFTPTSTGAARCNRSGVTPTRPRPMARR